MAVSIHAMYCYEHVLLHDNIYLIQGYILTLELEPYSITKKGLIKLMARMVTAMYYYEHGPLHAEISITGL